MIFVTGGTGLVGSHLLFELAKADKKTRALKRSDTNLAQVKKTFSFYSDDYENLFNKIEWVNGDLLDAESVKEAMSGADIIYHAAAMVSFNPTQHPEMLRVNMEGTANVMNAALELDVKKVCHVSSVAALGRANTTETVTENTLWKPSTQNSCYSISKFGAEREVWRASEEGLNVVVVNPAVIIGPGNWNQGSTAIFRVSHKGIKYYPKGASGFVDVKDVVSVMVKLAKSNISGERFIVSSENLSYKEFFKLTHENFNMRAPFIEAGNALTGIAWRAEKLRSLIKGSTPVITKEIAQTIQNKHTYSNKKIKEALGFEFIPVEKSVADTCRIFLKKEAVN